MFDLRDYYLLVCRELAITNGIMDSNIYFRICTLYPYHAEWKARKRRYLAERYVIEFCSDLAQTPTSGERILRC